MKLFFNINYRTEEGNALFVSLLEKGSKPIRYQMAEISAGSWTAEVDYFGKKVSYHYEVQDEDGNIILTEPFAHHINFPYNIQDFRIFDFWTQRYFPENFLTNKVLFNALPNKQYQKLQLLRKHTHLFRIGVPLYRENWKLVLCGNHESLGKWDLNSALEMQQTSPGFWEIALEINSRNYLQYKYGIKDIVTGEVIALEEGDNRFALPNMDETALQIKNDLNFQFLDGQKFHAAGVVVPVFSLRTENSFGVGEFPDLKLLADWCAQASVKMIQILPINDTSTSFSWADSYPYSAISVYALHPQYLSIEKLPYKLQDRKLEKYSAHKIDLNSLAEVDYEKVMKLKREFLQTLYSENFEQIQKDKNFKKFITDNQSWLCAYAAFCVQRDKNGTPDFEQWKTHKKYIAGKISPMFSAKSKDFKAANFYCWVQYHLHRQLLEAVNYLHEKGISLKGDLPIGIYRHSVEAWTEPELFHLNLQAGAPPDAFSKAGQNWGFPTYNWEKMSEDGYQWWKNRFSALEKYFDALRIDHILGFFRIWQIPKDSVSGILGYFSPALAFGEETFKAGVGGFTADELSQPYLSASILSKWFDADKASIQDQFMEEYRPLFFRFKEEFRTQRQMQEFLAKNPEQNHAEALLALYANVLLIPEPKEDKTVYHPRFQLFETDFFKVLEPEDQQFLGKIHDDYFYRIQEYLWKESAYKKLPTLLDSTKMLICGEDLGLVPACVPEVMRNLAICALKVQRMPPDQSPYYDPRNADYLNVVTTSTHDSSTLRQWWTENRELSSRYFYEQLDQKYGSTPGELVPRIAEIILKQHLYNPAMLAIFPLQDWLAADFELRNPDPEAERINDPSQFPHYWRYRMHLKLEDLIRATSFSDKISSWITDSNRN